MQLETMREVLNETEQMQSDAVKRLVTLATQVKAIQRTAEVWH